MSKCDDHHDSLAPQCPDCLNHALADQERISADLRQKLDSMTAVAEEWRRKWEAFSNAEANLQRAKGEIEALRLEVEFLSKNRAENITLRTDIERWKRNTAEAQEALIQAMAERDGAKLQKDALWQALSELVHGVEDCWNHVGRCEMGTDTKEPVDCECGRDAILEEPLAILAKIRPSDEGTVNRKGLEDRTICYKPLGNSETCMLPSGHEPPCSLFSLKRDGDTYPNCKEPGCCGNPRG